MSSPLQRDQKPTISKQTVHPTLGRRTPPRLRLSPLLSRRDRLRLNDNQTCDASSLFRCLLSTPS